MTMVDITGSFFCSNLRWLRNRYSLSKRALSRLIGISRYMLDDLESGRSVSVSASHILRLRAIFNIDVETLFHTDLSGQRENR